MRSLLIEFHRFGNLDTGLQRKDDPYLVAVASQPVWQVTMPLDYGDFLDLMHPLRYQAGADARENALKQIGGMVTKLLASSGMKDIEDGEFPLQLDLVVNAAELAALPFEAALDGDGKPLVVRSERPIILTRRVRSNYAETLVSWPAKARILFAWACPNGIAVQVPHQEHETALRWALSPRIPFEGPSGTKPDDSGPLTVLANASLDSIRKACQQATGEKQGPFTHVHLLAHGYPTGESSKQTYGLALHASGSDDLDVATPEAIAEALAPLRGTGILSLAACDSANAANTIIPKRSIAHELHVSGIPVVIASQLPLTVAGSTILVENFYGELLAGKDVRYALYKTRCALFKNKESAGHDWASLVGYVRLPEGYIDHLPAVRLKAVLTSLNAVQSWSDDLIKRDCIGFDRLAGLLRRSVQELDEIRTDNLPRGLLEENLGLLGSAEKRLSELYFECGRRGGDDGWRENMRASLERSRSWYRKGFECNLSNHWAGVQFLSLEAVLAGRISEPDRWYAAVLAARLDTGNVWAYGSLAELYLIASAAGMEDQMDKAQQAIAEMKSRVAASTSGNRFPLESTERQLRRYVRWWTAHNGFFPGGSDLSMSAERLVKVVGDS